MQRASGGCVALRDQDQLRNSTVWFLSLRKVTRQLLRWQATVESATSLQQNTGAIHRRQQLDEPADHYLQRPDSKHVMSIETAEQLKRELTDKWVVVADEIPELRRFAELTGKVRTVNMNCRALVEFDGPEDIAWYDIDPQFLTVVDAPKPKQKEEAKAKPATAKKAAPTAKTGGGNPLDQIRGGGAANAKPAAGGSPLDKIRASGGGAAAAPAGGSPLDKIRASGAGAAAAKPAAGGSPLDKIRASAGGAAAAPAEAPAEKEEAAPAAEAKPEKKESKALPPGTSPLDAIRAQGGFKG